MSKLDDKRIAAFKGPEAGKSVMRIRDGLADGLWLRVTKHTNKQGVEAVSKSWEFYFTLNGKTSCTGLGRWVPTSAATRRCVMPLPCTASAWRFCPRRRGSG